MENEGNICHFVRRYLEISNLSPAQKMNLEQLVRVTLNNIK